MSMKRQVFEISGLIITVDNGNGYLSGTLKETCPDCDSESCKDDCNDPFTDYNSAMDGIESFLLAMACQGVKLDNKRIIRALQDTLEACANNL